MSSSEEFFEQLQGRRKALCDRVHVTIRIDLDVGNGYTQHWYIEIDNDLVRTTREDRDADCVIRGTREVMDSVTSGNTGFVAALLRNELAIRGDAYLFSVFRKLLPSVPNARDPRSLRQRR